MQPEQNTTTTVGSSNTTVLSYLGELPISIKGNEIGSAHDRGVGTVADLRGELQNYAVLADTLTRVFEVFERLTSKHTEHHARIMAE